MPSFFFIIFCAISILELYAEASGNFILRYVSKPLIMIWLMFFYTKSVNNKAGIFYLFLFAFIFSLAGDVFLMFTDMNPNIFLFGLAAFLITHILYIIGFTSGTKPSFNLYKIVACILVAVYGFALLSNLWAGLEEMKIPVAVYASAICIMVIIAILYNANQIKSAYLLILIGAIFFMISDSLIALNKFGEEIPKASIYIMATYIIAQFYIVTGVVNRLNIQYSSNPE